MTIVITKEQRDRRAKALGLTDSQQIERLLGLHHDRHSKGDCGGASRVASVLRGYGVEGDYLESDWGNNK